jgi:hypothetical protein
MFLVLWANTCPLWYTPDVPHSLCFITAVIISRIISRRISKLASWPLYVIVPLEKCIVKCVIQTLIATTDHDDYHRGIFGAFGSTGSRLTPNRSNRHQIWTHKGSLAQITSYNLQNHTAKQKKNFKKFPKFVKMAPFQLIHLQLSRLTHFK